MLRGIHRGIERWWRLSKNKKEFGDIRVGLSGDQEERTRHIPHNILFLDREVCVNARAEIQF